MKKKTIIVAVILLIIGIAVTLALIFNKTQKEDTNGKKIEASVFAIPEVSGYYGKEKICDINGYVSQLDAQYIRDTIIPIAPNGKMPIKVKANENKIKSIAYEITNTEDGRLIDGGDIDGWKEKEGIVSFSYEASAILEPGTEYFLNINIVTNKHKNIDYYTRVMVTGEEFVEEQIKFAKEFSDNTFDEAKATKLVAYIEPDASLPDDNLGQVTIKSSYGMLTWKDLKPKKVSKTNIVAKEFCIKDSGEAGTYTMTYQIEATNAQKKEERYNVAETITVWTFAGKQYVLAYDREVNQVWKANAANIGNSFIDFGIQNITNIEHVESENQQYISYAINGDIYLMDVLNKEITSVFRLNADSSKKLYETRAKVIKVDDEGNVDYMIYGYSPSDKHVGKNGIFVIQYNKKENQAVEKVFIPCAVPSDILENQLSQLCYIGDGTLYIMLENSMYYVNLETKEWGTLAANLEQGSYAVNQSGTVVAFNTSGGRGNSDSITVVDLTNGKKSIIEAEEGNKVTVCGYAGTNLIYGIGKENSSESYEFFPIYKLEIVNENLEEIKSYSKNNVYIRDVEITDTIINIKRWKKGKQISDDQLLDNTEAKTVAANSSYYLDDVKQKELALSFTNKLDASAELKVGKTVKVIFDSNAEVVPKFEKSNETNYYVYGYGKLQKICKDKNEAIKAAREAYGLVTNENGQKIWIFEENYE